MAGPAGGRAGGQAANGRAGARARPGGGGGYGAAGYVYWHFAGVHDQRGHRDH